MSATTAPALSLDQIAATDGAATAVSDSALMEACQAAADASMGDSNDGEIEALREALDLALSRLGMTMPEPNWDDED